jgi:hypothetical protein
MEFQSTNPKAVLNRRDKQSSNLIPRTFAHSFIGSLAAVT